MPSFWPERLTEAVVAEARGAPVSAPTEAQATSDPAWERWFERALEQGVGEELAGLGRALMREASEASWADDQAAEGGLFDEGEGMLELALLHPELAQARWQALIEH